MPFCGIGPAARWYKYPSFRKPGHFFGEREGGDIQFVKIGRNRDAREITRGDNGRVGGLGDSNIDFSPAWRAIAWAICRGEPGCAASRRRGRRQHRARFVQRTARMPRLSRAAQRKGHECRRTSCERPCLERRRNRPNGFARASFQFHTAQQFESWSASPNGFLALDFEHQRCAGSGNRLFFSQRENRRSIFDGAAESIPIRNRDAIPDVRRNQAKIQHNDAESARVEQIIGGFERVPGVVAATDPDQLRESYAGRCSRYRIERDRQYRRKRRFQGEHVDAASRE